MTQLPALVPAVVVSYDRLRRECRVEIPGLTDGAEIFPVAQFAYPIGDKSEHTEIRILPGDRIWVAFEQGDPRFPIIMGYRPKQVGNEGSVEYRRWHHENIETDADETQKHTAGTSYTVESGENQQYTAGTDIKAEAAESVEVQAGTTILLEAQESITLKVGGTTITLDASSIQAIADAISLQGAVSIDGSVSQSGGTITSNGVSIDDTHTHTSGNPGTPTSPPIG